jgi:hypothetical protein
MLLPGFSLIRRKKNLVASVLNQWDTHHQCEGIVQYKDHELKKVMKERIEAWSMKALRSVTLTSKLNSPGLRIPSLRRWQIRADYA